MNQKRVFLILIYFIIFLFSIYSIIHIRYVVNGDPYDERGQFVFLFLASPKIEHVEFIMIKLTLFALTATLSFMLMLTNYYAYQNPNNEKQMISELDKEVKEIKKKQGKKT